MRIAVDLDDTIGNYHYSFGKALSRLSDGASFVHLPVPSSWLHVECPSWGPPVTAAGGFMKVHTELVRRGYMASMPVIEGAREFLELLRSRGHHIQIVTHRLIFSDPEINHRVIADTGAWLSNNDIPFDDLIFTSQKAALFPDLAVDDSPSHLNQYSSNGKTFTVRINRPYNISASYDMMFNSVAEIDREVMEYIEWRINK